MNTEQAEQKSYAEIAEILKTLGIEGVTEQLISELEKSYSQIPSEIILNKTAILLSALGEGNYDNSEWKPSSKDVYSFDVEVFDTERMYTNFLLGVSALGGGELDFQNLQEDTSNVNWKRWKKKKMVKFEWNGQSLVLDAKVQSDWFDLKVADKLNQIIVQDGYGKKLFFTNDGYQKVIIFYCDTEWAKSFENKTGLFLSNLIV